MENEISAFSIRREIERVYNKKVIFLYTVFFVLVLILHVFGVNVFFENKFLGHFLFIVFDALFFFLFRTLINKVLSVKEDLIIELEKARRMQGQELVSFLRNVEIMLPGDTEETKPFKKLIERMEKQNG